jgi:hypothetical protein
MKLWHCFQRLLPFYLVSLAASSVSAASALSHGSIEKVGNTTYACKCYSGDSCWPSLTTWNALNTSVGGNLQKVVPPGASCYKKFDGKAMYNEAECSNVISEWGVEDWQYVETSQF